MKKHIGSKVRQIRELKGFSQEYIAMQIGISQRAYSKLENNETKLNWEKLTKIGAIFEMNPTDIATFDDNLVFNNCSQSGKFEHFNNHFPDKLIEQYEKRIAQLEEEIRFLRDKFNK